MLTRRQLMKAGAVSGAITLVGPGIARASTSLEAETVPRFVTPLPILPTMPQTGLNRYELAIRRFSQQILPEGHPATQVLGYGAPSDPRTFHAPAFTIEARVNRPIQVIWRNHDVTHLHGGLGAYDQSAATHRYDNDQRATALWLHGMTNDYAGLYLLRGGPGDISANYPEIPLVIQDYAFNADGSLSSRTPDTITVNGRTWPILQVEPRRYRFRILNASKIRELLLKFADLPIDVIGTDGGFLPAATRIDALPTAAAERYDVIVDFSGIRPGTDLYLTNDTPNANPATTGQIMKFTVTGLSTKDASQAAIDLNLPAAESLGQAEQTRQLSISDNGLGTFGANKQGDQTHPITPTRGTTEIWELHNRTNTAHSIHVHQTQFEILGRRTTNGLAASNSWERGRKDTVLAPAGQITRVKARFDIPGQFAWHSHGTELIRPYHVA